MSGFGYSHKNDVGFVDGVLTLYSHLIFSLSRLCQTEDYKIGICCFSARHAA
jgi:hypothetical protein